VNDTQEGVWCFYNESGDFDSVILFEHGVMHGLSRFKQGELWIYGLIKGGEVVPIIDEALKELIEE